MSAYLYVCDVCLHVCVCAYVEIETQLVGVSPLFISHGFGELNLNCQAWQQESRPPTHQ